MFLMKNQDFSLNRALGIYDVRWLVSNILKTVGLKPTSESLGFQKRLKTNSSIKDHHNVSNPFQHGPDSMAFGNGNYFSNQRGFDHGIQMMQQQQGPNCKVIFVMIELLLLGI